MVELRVKNLTVSVGQRLLLADVSFNVSGGSMVAVVGCNGAGKSTLLRAIIGYCAASGSALVDDVELRSVPPAHRARLASWLPQALPVSMPARVRDAVALGRHPYGMASYAGDVESARAVNRAIEDTDIGAFADRDITSLSGGELARVHIARILAAETPVLLIDEPVAALDPAQRLGIMAMLRQRADAGAAILVVLHDLGLAARYCDRVIALKSGALVGDDAPTNMVTPPMIRTIFGVEALVDDSLGWPNPVMLAPAR